MKKYQHRKEKKPTERVSFYIALSICMMAVGFAALMCLKVMDIRI